MGCGAVRQNFAVAAAKPKHRKLLQTSARKISLQVTAHIQALQHNGSGRTETTRLTYLNDENLLHSHRIEICRKPDMATTLQNSKMNVLRLLKTIQLLSALEPSVCLFICVRPRGLVICCVYHVDLTRL
jgi:hypothetical protein